MHPYAMTSASLPGFDQKESSGPMNSTILGGAHWVPPRVGREEHEGNHQQGTSALLVVTKKLLGTSASLLVTSALLLGARSY